MSISSLSSAASINPSKALEQQDQNKIEASKSEPTANNKATVKNTLEEGKNFFENFLSRTNKGQKPSNDVLNQKLADIKQKARLVKDHPLPNVVKDYIQEVKSFLTDVKDHAYEHQLNDEKLFEKMYLSYCLQRIFRPRA